MVYLGNKLKKLRLQAGFTQKQLAEKIGVTKSVISYYELHERCPSPEVLIKLARIFHVTTDYILGIETKQFLNVSDLNDEDIQFLQHVIDTLTSKRENNN